MRALLYTVVFSIPILTLVAFELGGIWTFLPIIEAFVLIPLLELLLPASRKNLNEGERDAVKHNPLFDWLLYLVPIAVYGCLFVFLNKLSEGNLLWYETLGMILSQGLVMGALGINVAHELGHRPNKREQFMAKLLLTAAQYTQFFIDHNKGHHRNVGTPKDAATAHYNESVYAYWFRVIPSTYASAWKIANKEISRKKKAKFSWSNEMLRMQFGQLILIAITFYSFGWKVGLYYLGAALFAIILLETVQYVEHYGLSRKKVTENRYENVRPIHSWNSNHMLGRLFLFELSRHSDHHYDPVKKYPLLDHWEESPQLPTGYPGCMLMSTLPPLWFKVVNPRIPEEAKVDA